VDQDQGAGDRIGWLLLDFFAHRISRRPWNMDVEWMAGEEIWKRIYLVWDTTSFKTKERR